MVALSFLAGSVPFSQVVARHFAGADLRRVGAGTVSGTALYEVSGFGPLALAGVFEVAKGTVGPLLARHHSIWVRALAVTAAIAGHNWCPWLRGAGGRGLSPALGATLVCAPEATVLLSAGMASGRLMRHTALVSLVCALGLAPLLGVRRGREGVALAIAVVAPLIAKRLTGNHPPTVSRWEVLRSRLLYDRDPQAAPAMAS